MPEQARRETMPQQMGPAHRWPQIGAAEREAYELAHPARPAEAPTGCPNAQKHATRRARRPPAQVRRQGGADVGRQRKPTVLQPLLPTNRDLAGPPVEIL